eukprot:m.211123 g.211123  ORF g.211123 m.211123 type:complete len:51 (+) comp17146_c1_seq62:1139-1291(+)
MYQRRLFPATNCNSLKFKSRLVQLVMSVKLLRWGLLSRLHCVVNLAHDAS